MKNSVSVTFMLTGILFTACLIIANIVAVKIVEVGPLALPASIVIFPVTYILNDVIAEVWGFKKARLIIWSGLAMNALMALFFWITIILPSASFWADQMPYARILGSTPRLVAASFAAYLTGSFLNAFVMSRMKVFHKGKHFGVRAVLSTVAGETADSFIFITVAFLGIFETSALLLMIGTQVLLKTMYEIIALPITSRVVKWFKRIEGVDVFDTSVSYNPFKVKDV
ncbi:MAG TPA: queuosine precursor transporter [Prolixibacteraceae bacterium]|nr:queuosine precursor transporter [Lentimicrobium sp.]HLN72403.1 queuosine precursor transporter [Prolixibacteraceae bacterium]